MLRTFGKEMSEWMIIRAVGGLVLSAALAVMYLSFHFGGMMQVGF